MPPYKGGLLKRKLKSDNSEKTDTKNEENILAEEDLINGVIDTDNDSDTDQEIEASDSDVEDDEVIFQSDEDSLIESSESQESQKSPDVADSETDGELGSDDYQLDTNKRDVKDSDSGAETGTAPSPSPSADETPEDKQDSKKKQKIRKKANPKEKKKFDSINEFSKQIEKNIVPVQQKDEYESGDTSDEEDRRNTVGDIPMWWYNEYPHVGYDLDGRQIMKPPQRDHIDEFLKKCEDPEFWRTVRDPSTGQDVVLAAEDLRLIQRLRAGNLPAELSDEYQPWVEWFSREVLATPVRAFPDHKRSFLPSRSDQRQISRIVHALKMGWTKTRRERAAERRRNKERQFYDLWGSGVKGEGEEEAAKSRGPRAIAAPRRPPPSHAESYNPPPEYLLDDREMKEWEKLSETPWKRKYTFLPQRHGSLRAVPAYPRYTRERFLRCLDLYLAPRAIKMRLTINAEDLVPKLPSPRELQPFPTAEVLRLAGHRGLVRSVDFDPSGQYIVSCGEDGTVKIWETASGRCLRTLAVGGGAEGGVCACAWTPARGLSLVAAAAGAHLLLLNPGAGVGAHRVAADTDDLLAAAPPAHDVLMDARTAAAVRWEEVGAGGAAWARGERVRVWHAAGVARLAWHARGDYLAATLAAPPGVVVHQLSRRRSQLPFRRARGLVQQAIFHPHRPQLFVATQRAVRVYDLVKQELVRKLLPGAQWISAMALHPAGDNLLVASYDRKCVWFDLELSGKPYQTLRLHGGAVRAVAFHSRYPLFASAGDDHVVVSHGMVYNDLLQNPLLVPLKQLRAGAGAGGLCVLDAKWHPAQPWLLAAAADGSARLYA